MNRSYLPALLLILTFLGCTSEKENAQAIIDKAIDAHGGSLYERSIIEFDFRGRHYILERNKGHYNYHRIFNDSAGSYHDILDNNGFTRLLNNQEVEVESEWARRYSNSINSVAYFALLPFGLNDPAVNKNYIGEEDIDGENFYKIRVTFDQQGGGEHHEDVFVYWINKGDYRMNYFGYYYLTDGGGMRFREAVNQRKVNGLVFSDYINYKGPDNFKDVGRLAYMFTHKQLEKLSEINVENLEVRRFN